MLKTEKELNYNISIKGNSLMFDYPHGTPSLMEKEKKIPKNVSEKIQYTENIKDLIEQSNNGIFEHLRQRVKFRTKPFALVIKNEKKEIVGILTTRIVPENFKIRTLWVREDCRGKGYGTMLVKEVEKYARKFGYNHITLGTFGAQAPGFYKKLGYELEFIRKNKDPKFTKYFFIKRFK